MASVVTFNGSNYVIPATGDTGWGNNVSSYLIAIAAGALQKTGGSFTLSAEVDFGASFGVKSLYVKSRSINTALTGAIRLAANADSIVWRRNDNTGDLPLTVNASNQLTFNGNAIPAAGSQVLLPDGSISDLALTFLNQTNLGLYRNGSNDMRLVVNGTDKVMFRISDVLINTNLNVVGPNPIANVVAYGAVGDGSTDDATSIQNAINAINSNGGGKVYFPKGTYIVGTKLTVYSNTTLEGAAYGSVTIKAKDNLNDKLLVNNSGSSYITFKNIIFDMNGVNQSASTAVTIASITNHQVISCEFKNAYDSIYLLTGSPSTAINTNILFDQVTFTGTNQVQATDLVDIGSGTNIQMRNCKAFDAKAGSGISMLSIAIVDQFIISDSYLDGNNNGSPLIIHGAASGKIDGCDIKNSAEAGIRVESWAEILPEKFMKNFAIVNNHITNSNFAGIWIRQEGTLANTPLNLVISGNTISNSQRQGLQCQTVVGLKVNNNDFFNNSLSGVGSYYAMDFTNATANLLYQSNILIYDNRFYDTQGTPTQTKLYLIDWTNQLYSQSNLISEISTISTVTNSTNIYIIDANGIVLTASRAMVTDSTGIPTTSTTTATEIGYLSGVTSAIQTQLNSKAPTASPTFTGTITTPLTASRALQTGSSSELQVSVTTTGELAFLSGVTSSVQTQLNSKVPTSTTITAGTGLTGGGDLSTNRTISLSTPVSVANGGTNSTAGLGNNRVMISSGGAIVEQSAITASSALASDTNGLPVASSTTSTELGFVAGVTSAIQTQLNGKMGFSDARFTIATLTRDLTTATGSVAYTGVGFSPKALLFIAVVDGTTKISWGMDNAAQPRAISSFGANYTNWGSNSIAIADGSGNSQVALVSSLDSDGFTLSWTKAGTPTGTAVVYYLAFR